ncbi:MAG: tRNA pseudouridine(38-40) synthase TruA [Smithellaceae bacterium]|jgi:tRNA pseudouridine38-40 synthase|nr:tRNA pseudouridine(38-40) synthase TruA [Smithellaceae bacterium]MDD3259089.1 tRNA pseudouridine(38-40) synthase TruA [Smithellaceae bacterium]MDD3847757.1 tRNA pseudouridine(38-40) synthase TruA [Smithellaceae bacterium]
MSKYKIVLEYDGTNYSGWQAQKNARSIQETLIAAARKFLGVPVELQGAGRTDAGVHALGQVAHLECARKVNGDALRMGINDLLPAGINILSAQSAHPRFHARHSAVARSYLYLIATRRTAFAKKYVWWVKDSLHIGKMRRALQVFEGFHDFSSFADKRMEKSASTTVHLESARLEEFGQIIAMRLVGSHFLWKMARRIVGMTVEAGRGQVSAEDLAGMLKNFSDAPARHTAPPSGLFLEKVLYEGDRLPDIQPPVHLL